MQGQCPCPQSGLTCKLEWQPVCDTRGKTHANMCEAYKAGAVVDHHVSHDVTESQASLLTVAG